MKRALFAILLLAAATARADDAPPPADYSREKLMVMFKDYVYRPDPFVEFHQFGAVVLHTSLGKVKIPYLPVPPLQGSYPTISQQWPDPFILTGTVLATPPHAWDH